MILIESVKAYDRILQNANSWLVDVRTEYEWSKTPVSSPESVHLNLLLLSWKIAPDMSLNPTFGIKLTQNARKDCKLFFICRSGVRSMEAALYSENIGYTNCFNIIDGVEGNTLGKGWINAVKS